MQIPFDPLSFFRIAGLLFIIVPLFILVTFIIIAVKVFQSDRLLDQGCIASGPVGMSVSKGHQDCNESSSIRRIRLPSMCPSCGGSLCHEGIDWVAPMEAKCNYCSSTVTARFEGT